MADERTLAFLRELECADGEVAVTLAELEGLASQVDELRRRAGELEALLARIPTDRERLQAARAGTSCRAEAARAELDSAERDLAAATEAGDERRQAPARNAVVRARDALHMAERGTAEADAELTQLESDASSAESEIAEVVARAARLARELRERPRLAETAGAFSGDDLSAVADWAGGARAALFVATGSLAAERAALTRQANELGAVVLGEPVVTGSAAEVARRVEQSA